MSTLKVDTLQTTGGAGLYPAKAWVNFNGSGTVAIRADGNVDSITDNGTGDFTVNFTTAAIDANYSVCGLSYISGATVNCDGAITIKRAVANPLTTTSVRLGTGSFNQTLVDNPINAITTFR